MAQLQAGDKPWRSVDKSPFRDEIRLKMYNIPVTQIQSWLEEETKKAQEQGKDVDYRISYPALHKYKADFWDEIVKEWREDRNKRMEERSWQRKKNEAIDLCDMVIERAKEVDWSQIPEKDLVRLGIEAGKARNVLIKDEPDAEGEGIQVGHLDEVVRGLAKQFGDAISRAKQSPQENSD